MFCQGRDVVVGFTLAGRRAVSDESQIVRQNSSNNCSCVRAVSTSPAWQLGNRVDRSIAAFWQSAVVSMANQPSISPRGKIELEATWPHEIARHYRGWERPPV